MLESITSRGMFIEACSLPGETRADNVFPAHPNGLPLSRDRWLVLYATRGFRGGDDDLSTVYQLRQDTPDGPLLKEGLLARTSNDWDPLETGEPGVKQCGHPVAFGVPKGAVIAGRPAPSANVFVAKWRTSSRRLDRETNRLLHWNEAGESRYLAVEWVQYRLNDAEDDIEILQPAKRLRQLAYESGAAFCQHQTASRMNQSFVLPVPYSDDGCQWVVTDHFDQSRLAPLRFAFDSATKLYEWVETGPFLNDPQEATLYEASTLRYGSDWLVAGRTAWGDRRIGWLRTNDLFAPPPPVVMADAIKTDSPHTAYACIDGVVRVFTGDPTISPYGKTRCPLYCWDVEPDKGFAAGPPRVVFDSVAAGLPFALEDQPTMDMCKLLPHGGGSSGYLLHRTRDCCHDHPGQVTAKVATPETKAASGVYLATVEYDDDYPSPWDFAV